MESLTLKEIYKRSIKSRDIFWNKYIARPAAVPVLKLLYPTRITPNQITVFSFILALIAAIELMTVKGYVGTLIGAILIEISYMFDCADGMLARLRKESSKVGHLFDFLMDEIKAFFFLAAITTRHVLVDGACECWFLVGLWGLVALGGSIGLTGLIRREEYSGKKERFDGEHDAPPKPASILARMIRLAEAFARWVVHYPSYILYLGIAGTFVPYLVAYPLILWVYFVRTYLSVVRKLARSKQ